MKTCSPYNLLVLPLLLLAGCATTGTPLGPSVARNDRPPGTPAPGAILADLAKNDAAIQGFKASGKFILKSPQLEETLLLPQSAISFRRPANLAVSGRKMGTPVGRLTCVGDAFLLEDAIKRQYLIGEHGARFDGMSSEVSPADIARETFLPEDWGTLGSERVRMVEYKEGDQRATFELLDARGRKVHRRVEVSGPPWVVRRSELLDDKGHTLAITTKDDYRDNGGVFFPAQIHSEFPGENAFMEFEMRTFTLNDAPEAGAFDLRARLADIQQKGYEALNNEKQGNAGRLGGHRKDK